jgi:hypothetical protein
VRERERGGEREREREGGKGRTMMSTWSQSAPWPSTFLASAASCPKSHASSDGAMMAAGLDMLSALVSSASGWRAASVSRAEESEEPIRGMAAAEEGLDWWIDRN